MLKTILEGFLFSVIISQKRLNIVETFLLPIWIPQLLCPIEAFLFILTKACLHNLKTLNVAV